MKKIEKKMNEVGLSVDPKPLKTNIPILGISIDYTDADIKGYKVVENPKSYINSKIFQEKVFNGRYFWVIINGSWRNYIIKKYPRQKIKIIDFVEA